MQRNYHYIENPNANGTDGIPKWRSTFGEVAPGTLPFDSGKNFQEELTHPYYGRRTDRHYNWKEQARIPGTDRSITVSDGGSQAIYQIIHQAKTSNNQSESIALYKQAVDYGSKLQNPSLQALTKVEFGLAHLNWGFPQQGFLLLLEAGSNNPSLYNSRMNQPYLDRLSQSGLPQSAVEMLIRNGQQDPNWYLKDTEALSKLDKAMSGPVLPVPQIQQIPDFSPLDPSNSQQDYQLSHSNYWQESEPSFSYYDVTPNSSWHGPGRYDYAFDNSRMNPEGNYFVNNHYRQVPLVIENSDNHSSWQNRQRNDYADSHSWQENNSHYTQQPNKEGNHQRYHNKQDCGPKVCIPHAQGRQHAEIHHPRSKHEHFHSLHSHAANILHRSGHHLTHKYRYVYGQDESAYGFGHASNRHQRYAQYYTLTNPAQIFGEIVSAISGFLFSNQRYGAYGSGGFGRHSGYNSYDGYQGYRPRNQYRHYQQYW